MKSKVISVTCAAIMAFTLIGCGNQAESNSAANNATETGTAATEETQAAEATTEEVKVEGTFVKMNIPYGDFFYAGGYRCV